MKFAFDAKRSQGTRGDCSPSTSSPRTPADRKSLSSPKTYGVVSKEDSTQGPPNHGAAIAKAAGGRRKATSPVGLPRKQRALLTAPEPESSASPTTVKIAAILEATKKPAAESEHASPRVALHNISNGTGSPTGHASDRGGGDAGETHGAVVDVTAADDTADTASTCPDDNGAAADASSSLAADVSLVDGEVSISLLDASVAAARARSTPRTPSSCGPSQSPCDVLSSPAASDSPPKASAKPSDELMGVGSAWSPQLEEVKRVEENSKRRSGIMNKNADILVQARKSMGGGEGGGLFPDADYDAADAPATEVGVVVGSQRYCAATDTAHIASQLSAMQEEQIASLQVQVRQEREDKAKLEKRHSTLARERREAEDRVGQLEEELARARDTATDKRAAQKLRKLIGQQEHAIELLCQHVEAHQVMASLTESGLSQGEATAQAAIAAHQRHSLDIMCTLTEELKEENDAGELAGEKTPDWRDRDSTLAAKNLVLLINLRQDLEKLREENEELRQTADCCFVREQEAKYRSEELEAENKELQTFTEQMAATHSRLTQGVIELQAKQAAMVAPEAHEEVLAELAQLRADQADMVPHLNALLEEVETLKAAAAGGAGDEGAEVEVLREKCEALRRERDDERDKRQGLKTECDRLAGELAEAIKQHERRVAETEREAAAAARQAEEMAKKAREAHEECVELRKQLAEQDVAGAAVEAGGMEAELESAVQRVAALEQELEEARQASQLVSTEADAETRRAVSEAEQLAAQRDALEGERDEALLALAALEKSMDLADHDRESVLGSVVSLDSGTRAENASIYSIKLMGLAVALLLLLAVLSGYLKYLPLGAQGRRLALLM